MPTSQNPLLPSDHEESPQSGAQSGTPLQEAALQKQQDTASQKAPGTDGKPPDLSTAAAVRFYATVCLIIGVWYLLKHPEIQVLSSKTYWWLSIAGVVLVVVILLYLPQTKKWLGPTTPRKSAGYVIYGVIPALVILVGATTLMTSGHQANVLRVIFLAIVILLPATMYYLFIATRKVSLLNEFINNMDRLGLLSVQKENLSDEEHERQKQVVNRRFESYRRKFEALYGPVSNEDLQKALFGQESDSSRPGMAGSGMVGSDRDGSFFTSETAIPVVIASVLVALGWIFLLPLKRGQATITDWLLIMEPEKASVYFAFLGAYFFSLQMLFRRYVLRDLRPSAYVSVAMRIILAVVGTWVVAILSEYKAPTDTPVKTTNTLLLIGFSIGVFPSLVWQFVQAALKKVTFSGFFIPSLRSQLPISDLDGLTVWHEARLEEEDVENVPNMATADLVDLMLQTRFPPDRIIDWVDQAILYTHIGPEKKAANNEVGTRERLRAHGIRTATSLVEVFHKACAKGDVEAFEKILPAGNDGRSPLRGLADAVQTNPNFRIIWTWRELQEDQSKSATAA